MKRWPRLTQDEIDQANAFARCYIARAGQPLMLYQPQWDRFKQSGLDMSLFGLIGMMPRSDDAT